MALRGTADSQLADDAHKVAHFSVRGRLTAFQVLLHADAGKEGQDHLKRAPPVSLRFFELVHDPGSHKKADGSLTRDVGAESGSTLTLATEPLGMIEPPSFSSGKAFCLASRQSADVIARIVMGEPEE